MAWARPFSTRQEMRRSLCGRRSYLRIYEPATLSQPIVIAIDGTSASGKRTNARLVAQALGYVYVDASLDERTKRRAAEGVQENLAVRDQRDSQRAAAPLMVPLGARVINNSHLTSDQTSGLILSEVRKRLDR